MDRNARFAFIVTAIAFAAILAFGILATNGAFGPQPGNCPKNMQDATAPIACQQ